MNDIDCCIESSLSSAGINQRLNCSKEKNPNLIQSSIKRNDRKNQCCVIKKYCTESTLKSDGDEDRIGTVSQSKLRSTRNIQFPLSQSKIEQRCSESGLEERSLRNECFCQTLNTVSVVEPQSLKFVREKLNCIDIWLKARA